MLGRFVKVGTFCPDSASRHLWLRLRDGMDDLKKVSHLLYAPGEVMPGIEMSLAEARARGSAAALHDEVPFCVVRDWI